jgi:hypothetical protein
MEEAITAFAGGSPRNDARFCRWFFRTVRWDRPTSARRRSARASRITPRRLLLIRHPGSLMERQPRVVCAPSEELEDEPVGGLPGHAAVQRLTLIR